MLFDQFEAFCRHESTSPQEQTAVSLDNVPQGLLGKLVREHISVYMRWGNYQNWNYNQQKIWVEPNLIQRGHEYDIKAQINFDTDQDGYANRTVS